MNTITADFEQQTTRARDILDKVSKNVDTSANANSPARGQDYPDRGYRSGNRPNDTGYRGSSPTQERQSPYQGRPQRQSRLGYNGNNDRQLRLGYDGKGGAGGRGNGIPCKFYFGVGRPCTASSCPWSHAEVDRHECIAYRTTGNCTEVCSSMHTPFNGQAPLPAGGAAVPLLKHLPKWPITHLRFVLR